MTSIIVRPRALTDIDGALAWYAQRGAELSQRLLDELDVVSGNLAAIIAVIHQSRQPIDWNPRGR